jgi:glycosyltransferase involved in cell wall biosynthesis
VSRPRILVFAYACEPELGSEPGVGWGLVQSLARWSDPTVLIGPQHEAGIVAWQEANLDSNIDFVTVAEPGWTARVPHEPNVKTRAHSLGYFVAYLGWQRRALATARRLVDNSQFDFCYHATYSTYWLPSPARHLGLPFVWGPVGGAVTTPRALWRSLGLKGVASEILDAVTVRIASWWPGTRATWRAAQVRLVNNQETARRLHPRSHRSILLNHALFTLAPPEQPAPARDDYMLFLASFESRKGVTLALRGLAQAPPNVRMVVVGDGPERERVMGLIAELDLEDRVDLRGWLPYPEAQGLMDRAAALVSTGVREEGGAALAEAMIRGCPVIVLANGGARTLAEGAPDQTRVRLIRPGRSQAMAADLGRAMGELSRDWTGGRPNLDTEAAHRVLRQAFEAAAAI